MLNILEHPYYLTLLIQMVFPLMMLQELVHYLIHQYKMIEVANRVHSIKLSTQNNSIENIDIIEIDDNFVYGIVNNDWYIYVDKNNKIYHEIINIDSRAIEEYNNALMAIEEKFNLTKEVTNYGL